MGRCYRCNKRTTGGVGSVTVCVEHRDEFIQKVKQIEPILDDMRMPKIKLPIKGRRIA